MSKQNKSPNAPPNDYSIDTMVSFMKDQAGHQLKPEWFEGYRSGLIKMRDLMLEIIEQKWKN